MMRLVIWRITTIPMLCYDFFRKAIKIDCEEKNSKLAFALFLLTLAEIFVATCWTKRGDVCCNDVHVRPTDISIFLFSPIFWARIFSQMIEKLLELREWCRDTSS